MSATYLRHVVGTVVGLKVDLDSPNYGRKREGAADARPQVAGCCGLSAKQTGSNMAVVVAQAKFARQRKALAINRILKHCHM